MILVDPPEAPFEIIYDADTSDTLLNIVPPAGSQRMYLNAPGDKLDGWNKKKQTGSHTVWSTRNSDYDTGVVGTVRILNDPTDQVYLTNVDGSKKGLHLLPAGIAVDTTNHTITEEFVISNDSAGTDVQVIDDCSSADGWAQLYGDNVQISVESGRLKVTGSISQDGALHVTLTKSINLSSFRFLTFEMQSSPSSQIRCSIKNSDTVYKMWAADNRYIATSSNTKFVLPLDAPLGSSGSLPTHTLGTFSKSTVTSFVFGIYGVPGATATFYIDNITADTAKSATIEAQTPDNLSATSLSLYTHNGTAYQLASTHSLDSTYSQVSQTSENCTFLDGTKLDDVYGTGLGRAVFPKSSAGTTVNGSTGSITYSENRGTDKRIGLTVNLPPSDNGRTDFNKVRAKLVINYTDTVGNIVPDLSGNNNTGTIVGGVVKLNDGGLKFDGSTGYISIGKISALHCPRNFTIVTTISPSLFSGDYRTIYSSGYSNSNKNGIWLYLSNEDSKIHCAIGNGIVREDKAFATNINIGTVYKIIYTYDGSTAKLYLNGNLDGSSQNVTGDLVYNPISSDKIGVRDETTTLLRYLTGAIHTLSFYNRVWTQAEVTAYQNDQAVDSTGLVLHYTPKVSNMGSTTFEFTPQSLDHFTGLDNVGNWLAFERPDKRAEVFLFSRKLASLAVTEDDNGKLARIEVGVKKGTRVARSWVRYPDFDADGNSDDVPNFIDKIVEQLQNKFAFIYDYADIDGVGSVELQRGTQYLGTSDGDIYVDSSGYIYRVIQ